MSAKLKCVGNSVPCVDNTLTSLVCWQHNLYCQHIYLEGPPSQNKVLRIFNVLATPPLVLATTQDLKQGAGGGLNVYIRLIACLDPSSKHQFIELLFSLFNPT
jgi:hypothetical protein